MGVTKPCIHLYPAPSTSNQLHPALSISTQLISTSTQLHLPPPSSLQHPQQYSNQNIARNWVISPNLGRKIQSCPFWLKIGSHGILEVLILNPDLDFRNSDHKIHYGASLGPNRQSCPFCLKIGTHGISRTLIFIPTLVSWNSDPKIYFWANLGPKNQSCPFSLKIGTHGLSRMLIFIPTLVFWISHPKIHFGENFGKKSCQSCPFLSEKLPHMVSWEDANSYSKICFLNFQV